MRAIEDQENGYTWYSGEMRNRAATVLDLAVRMSALKSVLDQIKAEAENLRQLFFSDAEQKEMQAISDGFDLEMRKTKQSILSNLMTYRRLGWSKIFDEEQRQ